MNDTCRSGFRTYHSVRPAAILGAACASRDSTKSSRGEPAVDQRAIGGIEGGNLVPLGPETRFRRTGKSRDARLARGATVRSSIARQAAMGCGFNRSTQQIDEIGVLVFRSLESSSGVR
jgi:hypothetical protein